MRAAVLESGRHIGIHDVPVPHPGPGQVLVKVEGSGLCGSDLSAYEGRAWFDYPLAPGAPGHEGWGVVAVPGPGVEGWAEGDPVALQSFNAYAQYDLVNEGSVVPLPADWHDHLLPIEPAGCAVNAARRCSIAAGDSVAIVGIGFIGALLVQIASATAGRVVALSRRRSALDVAKACGADAVMRLGEGAAAAAIEANGGNLFDVVIECAGAQATLDVATELVRERGRLVVAGYHQDGSRSVDMQLWNWRGIDVINAHERDPSCYHDGMREAVGMISEGSLNLEPLITHEFRLEDLDDAFRAALERPEGFLKAVVRP